MMTIRKMNITIMFECWMFKLMCWYIICFILWRSASWCSWCSMFHIHAASYHAFNHCAHMIDIILRRICSRTTGPSSLVWDWASLTWWWWCGSGPAWHACAWASQIKVPSWRGRCSKLFSNTCLGSSSFLSKGSSSFLSKGSSSSRPSSRDGRSSNMSFQHKAFQHKACQHKALRRASHSRACNSRASLVSSSNSSRPDF